MNALLEWTLGPLFLLGIFWLLFRAGMGPTAQERAQRQAEAAQRQAEAARELLREAGWKDKT